MITLFRRIREKLIATGSFTKYTLYAIGEILLVVIGILIALQINNWNEEVKSRNEEQALLFNLKTDYETRLNELNEFQELRAQRLETMYRLTQYIANPDLPFETSEMDSLIANINSLLIFNEQFKVLDILFNTGKIDQIRNQNLKKLLLNWPQNVEEMMEEQRMRYRINFDHFIPLQYKYLSFRSILETYSFRGYEMSQDWPRRKKSDYRGLLEDPEFENFVAHLEILDRINIMDSDVLIQNAEQIIELLNSELNPD